MNRQTSTAVDPGRLEVSRRNFLRSASFSGALILMGKLGDAQDTPLVQADGADSEELARFAPDFFVAIDADGGVTCVAHRSEMGTGIRTSLPRVVADELGADWQRVRIEQAPGDKRLGDQNTDGSNSIRFFFDRMRVAGATARTMLEQAAAQQWGVDAQECLARDHQIVHQGTNRTLGFGQLVAAARQLPIPPMESLKFRPRSEWRYIGKDVPIVDLDEILTGKAIYGIDARMPGQLYAVIARPPVAGGKLQTFEDRAAKTVPGVVDVVPIPGYDGAPTFQPLGGVAVLAESTFAAWRGRDALDIAWDHGPNAEYDTEQFARELAETARRPGTVLRQAGSADAVLRASNRVVRADYSSPHLAHAPMEPTCAVAQVSKDATGKVTGCHVLAATQNPQAVQEAVGLALGLPPAEVLVHVTLLGSGFGRKSKPDYCVEAALLSRHTGRPVHVTWTREDDLQHDYYHTIAAVHCEAALDDRGMPEAWLQRAVYPTIGSTFVAGADEPAPWEAEMGHTDLPFAIPHLQLEVGKAKAHCRIGWLRSVCHIPQNFAVSSFADELAHAAGRDPLDYLLELLGDDRHVDLKAAGLGNRGASPTEFPYDIGRLKHVLRRAAELAGWEKRQRQTPGYGLGIACARSFLGYTGHVVEVEVTRSGQLAVPRVWVALDAGTIVSPDRVRAQVEGAAIMALTQARYGKVSFQQGRPQQTNYDSYRMVKAADAPREIVVEIVANDAAPAGVGETGVPSFAPALCNAIFAATGKRIRNLPLADHDLAWG